MTNPVCRTEKESSLRQDNGLSLTRGSESSPGRNDLNILLTEQLYSKVKLSPSHFHQNARRFHCDERALKVDIGTLSSWDNLTSSKPHKFICIEYCGSGKERSLDSPCNCGSERQIFIPITLALLCISASKNHNK